MVQARRTTYRWKALASKQKILKKRVLGMSHENSILEPHGREYWDGGSSYGLCNYGLCSYGLNTYGLNSYGLCGYQGVPSAHAGSRSLHHI